MQLTTIKLRTPYLVFLGDERDPLNAKTAFGIVEWARERCAGQLRFPQCPVDTGLPDLDLDDAISAGVGTVVIGVAPVGGVLQQNWIPPLIALARAGIDIASGLHSKLTDIRELVEAAQASGARLVDVRVPPPDLPCGLGQRRSGRRVLTVGTDCAVGKKYSALALQRELHARGVDATFRATGQTGIMIAGEGIPIDAVVSDFVSGAAEALSPDNRDEHWDVIEGQGSLIHPAYAGVTLGLIHGSQPDALVLCHDASRHKILEVDGPFSIPPLDELIDTYLSAARLTNPDCICVGISVNTSMLSPEKRENYLSKLMNRFGLPVTDPVAAGMRPIADFMLDRLK